jgi:hypothetical protein
MKRLFCILYLLICSSAFLQADWDPEFYLAGQDLTILNSLEFQNSKDRICEYLQHSWCSPSKIQLMMDLTAVTKPQICVDIGSFTGSHVLPVAIVLQLLKKGKIYAVDSWSNEEMIKYMDVDDSNKEWWSQVDMEKAYFIFRSMLRGWCLQRVCTIVRKSSPLAANDIDDNIDFLHLGGDFTEKGSLENVTLFLPKVRSGGYILLSDVSNIIINGLQPKEKTCRILFNECDMICEIDYSSTVLFRKR